MSMCMPHCNVCIYMSMCMPHSNFVLLLLLCCDLLSFYVCLEAQTFTFIILCGRHAFQTEGKLTHSFVVEASMKYLVLLRCILIRCITL